MSDNRPVLLLYCQHSVGIGHLRRSIAIVEPFTQRFRVVFLNGGRFPDTLPRPLDIDFIDLPALGMEADGELVSREQKYNVDNAKPIRRNLIIGTYNRLQPAVLLIELFPFGRKKFAFELLPLLRLAKRSASKPLIICSLRDILIDARRDQQAFDNRAAWLADRYFDAVLVHTDRRFANLDESFKPVRRMKAPVYYTGFALAADNHTDKSDHVLHPGIVVSAGGGIVGTRLLHAAVEAQPLLYRELGIPMTVVAGPFLPEIDWLSLARFGRKRPGLKIYRSVPNLRNILKNARVSVSQCGYNTVMDLLAAQVPSLVVPYAEGRENEQSRRAEKLCKLGILRTLPESELNPANLLSEIDALCSVNQTQHSLDLDGCSQTWQIVTSLLNGTRMKVEETIGGKLA